MVPWKIMNMGPPQNILPLRGSFSTDPVDCEVQHQQKLISFESQKDPKLAAVGNLHLHARLFSCFVDLKNNFLIFFHCIYIFLPLPTKNRKASLTTTIFSEDCSASGCLFYWSWSMVLLMEEILHQLMWKISIIYRVFYIPGGCLGFLPSTVSWRNCHGLPCLRFPNVTLV